MKKSKIVMLLMCLIIGTGIGTMDVKAAEVEEQNIVEHYDIRYDGGSWDGINYYLSDGMLVKNAFFCDGTYSYCLQNDGSPMKDRTSYYPDGEHIIYFDANGHEIFNEFVYCNDLKYRCYFDANGFMYKNQVTYKEGKAYYLDMCGRMKEHEWFRYDGEPDTFGYPSYGYAYADGSLKNDGFSYDPNSRVVFFQSDGKVAKGLISDGVYTYNMSFVDGHLMGQWK